ncbi:MAG: riboflavin kinase/FMN adenylyltransferase [Candidatus Azotimanducaceae bacterium]|jgi:riboflavin kinase/FMN adenylyltransferase
MEIIRGIHNLKPRHRGCVVTMGNFDGVHLGHQLILQQVKARSEEMGAPSLLICFEPQPKEFFDAYNAPARLTRFREKVGLLAEYGVDLVLCLKFDEITRSMSPQAFISLLVDDLQLKALFAGDDARFGNDRSGDFDLLTTAGKKSGFEVTNLYTLTVDAERVSSTRIRECLANGDFKLAEQLLGRPYSITGKVVYGRQLGRTLDAPTANIQLHRDRAPIDGVYAVEIQGLDKTLTGVANVGVRPTLDETTLKPILEVHIFDFAGTIYGKTVKVIFCAKIRDEKKFTGLEALKIAIREDMLVARQYFKDGSL